jgi:parallel beta-helix repeat protein
MLSLSCGNSNAQWATCKHFIQPSLPYVPVSGCGPISSPGNYLLQFGIANGTNDCINIESSNVRFSCGNLIIAPNATTFGSAIRISNKHNVSINLCKVISFPFAVNVSDSSLVTINGINAQSSNYGIILDRVTNSTVSGSTLNGSYKASIALYGTSRTLLINNLITYGHSNNYGIILNNSGNNTVLENSGSHNYVGMLLIQNSRNNTIINNTMELNTGFDYLCQGNDGLGAENGGINYGTTKSGCNWLAAITVTNPNVGCTIASQPSLFLLTSDYEYTTGSTCFSVFANSTTVNCAGHTVIATNGGTFASFAGAHGAIIENCFLKGFINTIVAGSSDINIFNNSVIEAPSQYGTAISLSNGGYSTLVHYNNVSAPSIGISVAQTNGGKLESNYVSNAKTAYSLYGVSSMEVQNNTAAPSTGTGILLNNSFTNIFMDNNLGSGTGISCITVSGGAHNNTDSGGNSCSSNLNCSWAPSASSC